MDPNEDDEMPEISDCLHPNVIIHIDFDYYYAQVEEVLNPELKNKPIGIKQRFHIVTCNYIARSYGIKKMDLTNEAVKKCPQLVIINGEDLAKYKTYAKRIAELLHNDIGPSERMGLDEHFLDLTRQVNDELSKMSPEEMKNLHFSGPLYPSEESFNECKCGCERRLMLGSQIAQTIRAKILKDLKLTCSVGIAHNKLLAKLAGQHNKPNNQTVLAPMAAAMYMAELNSLRSITGIGGRTASRIEELGINTIEGLQSCDTEKLQKKFGADMASRLKEMSMGVDMSEVKPSGKPKTVGLENSFKPTTSRSNVEKMFSDLLDQLVWQIQDDGRIPQTMKVTVRKYCVVKKVSLKETKQLTLLPSCFRTVDEKLEMTEGADKNIITQVMKSFDLMVAKQKFLINLIGLCFVKFQDRVKDSGSIAHFLKNKESRKNSGDVIQKEETIEEQRKEVSNEEKLPPAKRRKTEPSKQSSTKNDLVSSIDHSVWQEMPIEIQRELLRCWQTTEETTERAANWLS